MKVCSSIVVLLLIGAVSCHAKSNRNVTKSFHLNTLFKASWHRAQHHCLMDGMRLATIMTQKENDEVLKQIHESGFMFNYWVGGTSLGNPSEVYWYGNNKPVKFHDWAPGEPDYSSSSEMCIKLMAQEDFKWSVEYCMFESYFVCEDLHDD